jgi:hypothetical protein
MGFIFLNPRVSVVGDAYYYHKKNHLMNRVPLTIIHSRKKKIHSLLLYS